MFRQPVTFLFDFERVDDSMRPYVMRSFANAGAKHLVLSDTLISRCMQKEPTIRALQKEMADNGLTFVDAHSPFGRDIDLCCPDAALRRNLLLRHKLALEIAAQMGVDTMTIHVGNSHCHLDRSLDELHQFTVEALAELLPAAEACGIVICIENIWLPNNTAPRLNAIKAELPSPFLGFCYDAGHANLMHSKNAAFQSGEAWNLWVNSCGLPGVEWNDHILEDMLPNVVNCHLHDNNGLADQHRNIGRGNIDWQHVIGLLKKAPRLKNIQSEVIPCRETEPIPAICKAFEKLGELGA